MKNSTHEYRNKPNDKEHERNSLWSRAFAVLVFTLGFYLVCFQPIVNVAWADNEEQGATKAVDSSSNIVNVNQMPDSSFLYNTDISELSDAESFQDMQLVQVSGEVVGDHINDETNPNACWITLQSLEEDDASTVAVFMTNEQASLIDSYGNYRTTGTELQVRGLFYISCPEHQGLSDLHAQEVIVENAGSLRVHASNPAIEWSAVLVLGLGLLCFFTYRAMRERRK